MPSYAEFHRRSIEDPEGFWAEQAERLRAFRDAASVAVTPAPPT